MKAIFNLLIAFVILPLTLSSCLYSGLEEMENSSDKELMSVEYTYRFLYNDTIKKGTPNQEIQEGRVCEVVFKQQSEKIEEGGLTGFKTTLTHDASSINKGGPTGSVTNGMLYDDFKKQIEKEGLRRLWVSFSISDAAILKPIGDAPKLGAPGDFSKDRTYRIEAADGSSQDYLIKTVQGF